CSHSIFGSQPDGGDGPVPCHFVFHAVDGTLFCHWEFVVRAQGDEEERKGHCGCQPFLCLCDIDLGGQSLANGLHDQGHSHIPGAVERYSLYCAGHHQERI